jgi:uncharacterized protein HemX
MTKTFEFIFTNGENLTLKVLLLLIIAALVGVIFAFVKGTVPTPGEYKRIKKEFEGCQTVMDKAREELADSRILYAGAASKIEYLERDLSAKDRDISELRSRIVRFETELDVLRRERWTIPERREGD